MTVELTILVVFQCGDCGALNDEAHEPWCPDAAIGEETP